MSKRTSLARDVAAFCHIDHEDRWWLSALFVDTVQQLLWDCKNDASRRGIYELYLAYLPLVRRADRQVRDDIPHYRQQLRVLMGAGRVNLPWDRANAERMLLKI